MDSNLGKWCWNGTGDRLAVFYGHKEIHKFWMLKSHYKEKKYFSCQSGCLYCWESNSMGYRSSELGNLSCNMAKGFLDLIWNPLKAEIRGFRICHPNCRNINPKPPKEKLFPKVVNLKKQLSRGLARLSSQRVQDGWMCQKTCLAHQDIIEMGKRRSTGSSLTFPSHSPCRTWLTKILRGRRDPGSCGCQEPTQSLQEQQHHTTAGPKPSQQPQRGWIKRRKNKSPV